MPRRGNIARRDVLPDPLYNSKLVTRLINNIMLDGKKGVAQKIVYGAFDIVKEKTGKDPLEAFEQAMENIMPVLEIKARRVGGATYQVPMEVRPERRQTLGLRWLAHGRYERPGRRLQVARGYPQDGRGQQGFCPFQMVIPATTAFLLFFAPVGMEFANLLGGHYAKRCILRENA